MSCHNPKDAWITRTAPFRVVFNWPDDSQNWSEIALPCGHCSGCRRKNARDWTIRLSHEAEYHEQSSFITLTYNDEHLPKFQDLDIRDLQLFLKRLRKDIAPVRVRYFACAEYGENYSRPHFHIILFGIDIANDVCYNINDLERTWGKGFVTVGSVTEKSIAYVAGYVQKKIDKSENDYVDKATGVIRNREFICMSRNPGIGQLWIHDNLKDTYLSQDSIRLGYQTSKPPRYYDKQLEKISGSEALEEIKRPRVEEARKAYKEDTPEKREARRKIEMARLAKRKRRYET